MGLFDCGRCGAKFSNEEQFEDHRKEIHGINPKWYPGYPQSAHEKNLNGHTRASDVRRDPNRGKGTGGNVSVD